MTQNYYKFEKTQKSTYLCTEPFLEVHLKIVPKNETPPPAPCRKNKFSKTPSKLQNFLKNFKIPPRATPKTTLALPSNQKKNFQKTLLTSKYRLSLRTVRPFFQAHRKI